MAPESRHLVWYIGLLGGRLTLFARTAVKGPNSSGTHFLCQDLRLHAGCRALVDGVVGGEDRGVLLLNKQTRGAMIESRI